MNDRAITKILAILEKCPVMRLGLSDAQQPYVVPLNFSFRADGGTLNLYFHCAAAGRKLDIIAYNPKVCFEADCSFELLRADRPCDWSALHESVIGFGTASVLSDGAEKTAALDLLMARYGFEGKPDYDEQILARTKVVKIEVSGVSAKRHGA